MLESNRDLALYALGWSIRGDEIHLSEQLEDVDRDRLDASSWLTDSHKEERDELLRELAEARRELFAWEQKSANETNAARLIEASGLPEFAVTESFRQQLGAAAKRQRTPRVDRGSTRTSAECRSAISFEPNAIS